MVIAALIVCSFLYAALTRAAFMLSSMVGGERLISFFISQMGERTYIDANGVELGGMEALRKHLLSQLRDLKGCLNEHRIHDCSE